MKLLDIRENLPIQNPIEFTEKLLELMRDRSKSITGITVAIRTDDGYIAVATSGDNLGASVYEFTCAINATITGTFMKVTEIRKDDEIQA